MFVRAGLRRVPHNGPTLRIYRAKHYRSLQPGLLKPPEVYAVVAYILNLNGIVEQKQVIDAKSLPKIKMPNRNGFVPDPRPDVRPR